MTDTTATTGIPLLERDQVSPEIAAVYDALLKQRGVVPNMFKTLAHTPALALGVAGLLKSLLSDGALPGGTRNWSPHVCRCFCVRATRSQPTHSRLTEGSE